MKTKLVPIRGNIEEALYQIGLDEKASFSLLEERVNHLLSRSSLLRTGHEILAKAKLRFTWKKDEELSFFHKCVKSYAEGLGTDLNGYLNFLALFEVAAHYGQKLPDLLAILPGCTSVFLRTEDEISHTRLMDFPLIGIFEEKPRLYLWEKNGKPLLLTYSCEGLAPLFLQGLHGNGISFALHHKPGKNFYKEGTGVFEILFNLLFQDLKPQGIKKELKASRTKTKWGFFFLDKTGHLENYDIEGPSFVQENIDLPLNSPLVYTNIPLREDDPTLGDFISFCQSREEWAHKKLSKNSKVHPLDLLTDVSDQKVRSWNHPASTLATTGALWINLSQGFLDLKEGEGALVASDSIIRVDLAVDNKIDLHKSHGKQDIFERAWKRASLAQAYFDQEKFDLAYHELQMARAMVHEHPWEGIFLFFLCTWDFLLLDNMKELAHVYKTVKALTLPKLLEGQHMLLIQRIEKKLKLQYSVSPALVPDSVRKLYEQEREANKALFSAWMGLIYPRMEQLTIHAPHLK
jgi:hypothetical protein